MSGRKLHNFRSLRSIPLRNVCYRSSSHKIKKTLVQNFKIETVVTMEQIYEGNIRNEHFGLTITALSNTMSCGLAGVYLQHFGVYVPPYFHSRCWCFPHFKASIISLRDSDLHCRRRKTLVISQTCRLYRLTARSQTLPQEIENNHERVLRCPAPFFYAEQN